MYFGFISCVFPCLLSVCFSMKWDVFSTKTLYKWAVPVRDNLIPNEENTAVANNRACQAIHVSGVFRHGARNPTLKNLKKIKNLHNKLVTEKKSTTFLDLNTWKFEYNVSMEGQLVSEGIAEQFGLGQRFVARFYEMYNKLGERVDLVSSSVSRAKDSSRYFYQGMADFLQDMGQYNNTINDTLLRFYDDCEEYDDQADETDEEFEKFDDTTEFQMVQESVKERLGMDEVLSSDELYQVYDLCSYETYVHQAPDSVWCRLLTDAERKVLEYGQDIEKWYESSYGGPLNSKLACPLVQDLLTSLETITSLNTTWTYLKPITLPGYVAGRFYFGHSDTVSLLLTALGLFKDDQPLRANNMAEMQNRKFKSSTILPYSANIAFAVYACPLDSNSTGLKEDQQFLVKLFVNEQSVNIPACGQPQCNVEDVLKAYKPIVDNCNLKEMCEDDDDDKRDGNGGVIPELSVLIQTLFLMISYTLMKTD